MSGSDDPFATLAEDTLNLERLGPTRFRSEHRQDNSMGVVFGGQFLAQGLLAASETVPGWPANSCSAYFLRPGNFDAPIDYEVELVRDGRRFANRRVVASQSGKALFDMLCSFHAAEEGRSHQAADIAGLPPAESSPCLQDYLRANADRIPLEAVSNYLRPLPVQLRLIDPDILFHLAGAPVPRRSVWMRFPAAARVVDSARHQPLIAFVSDFWLGPAVNDLHGPPFPHRLPVHTTSHSIAFHGPARADEWLLYKIESPFAGEGIGFTRGLLFDRQGRLICSTTQEVAMGRG